MLTTGSTPSSLPQGECLPPEPQTWALQRGRRWQKGEYKLARISDRCVGFTEPGNRKAGHGTWQSESGCDTALTLLELGPWTGVTT